MTPTPSPDDIAAIHYRRLVERMDQLEGGLDRLQGPPDQEYKTALETCADAAARQPLNPGEVVFLKSSSPEMTVIHADCIEACVGWFDGATYHEQEFRLECLTKSAGMPF